MAHYNRERQQRRRLADNFYKRRRSIAGTPAEDGFLEAVSFSGLPLRIPVGTLDHEIKTSELTERKIAFSLECARESRTIGPIAEYFAGFGGLTVEYHRDGSPVFLCVEKDATRAAACAANVQAHCNDEPIVICADNTRPLWYETETKEGAQIREYPSVEHCGLLDFDSYNDPVPALLTQGGSGAFREGQYVLTTCGGPIAWRLHLRARSYLANLQRAYGPHVVKAANVIGASGIFFSREIVAPFFKRIGFPLAYVGEMPQPPKGTAAVRGSIERVLWKVTK